MKRVLLLLAFAAATGCAAQAPPPGWHQGGAALVAPRATWNAGWTSVEVLPDGRVIVNGVEWFTIDRAGRVLDGDGQPVAMLREDGQLVGSDGEDMGVVGVTSAAGPGEPHATVAIAPDGRVLRYDDEGLAGTVGAWSGCGAHAQALQTCTLVTHLVSLRFPTPWPSGFGPATPYGAPMAPGFSSSFGVGLGGGIAPP